MELKIKEFLALKKVNNPTPPQKKRTIDPSSNSQQTFIGSWFILCIHMYKQTQVKSKGIQLGLLLDALPLQNA